MSEQQAAKLFHGITGIDGDLIDEALDGPRGRNAPVWRRWGALAACLCLAALAGVGIWRWTETADGLPGATADGSGTAANTPGDNNGTGDMENGCDTLPGGITPVLRVGDTLYEWTRLAQRFFLDPGGSYNTLADGSTYLPEGYEAYGEISGVVQGAPTEDLQLQAGFEASGTVFISEEHPAVAYVLMSTDWFEDAYVRFASEALGNNELIRWQERMYRFSTGTGLSELVEKLPEGCELIGKLHYVGDDAIPSEDLETNCRGDSYAKPVDGREVYALPGDDSVLYVYEHCFWREGDYPAWRACHLWER